MASTTIRQRLSKCMNPPFSSESLRGIVTNCFIAITMGEYILYMLINSSIKNGELPWYTIDLMIVCIASLEALVAPLLSWLGWRRRRMMMLVAVLLAAAVAMLVVAVPVTVADTGTEYCGGNSGAPPPGASVATGLRVAVVTLVAVAFATSRIILWCHGVAYMAEHTTSDLSMHFGILAAARVIAMTAVPKILHGGMALWLQGLSVLGPLAIHALQLLRIPAAAPPAPGVQHTPLDGRGFMSSLGRVVGNRVVMTQMVTNAILATALWGFAYHHSEIMKVKYNVLTTGSGSSLAALVDINMLFVIVIVIVAFGMKFTPPLMSSFSRTASVKLSMVVSVIMIPVYVIPLVLFNCEKGVVAGLGNNYTQPGCSHSCGCSPRWTEYNPVCVTDQMTTYLSPCHAGCARSELFGGISFLQSCQCSPTTGLQRATFGACSDGNCFILTDVSKIMLVIIATLTVLAFQAQGVLVLKSVDPRDRGVALGVGCSLLALVTFGCGHMAYFGIAALTCSWFEGGRCHLQSEYFPYMVIALSSFLALLSALINLAVFLSIRNEKQVLQKTPSDPDMVLPTRPMP